MGWSCSTKASYRMDQWTKACVASTGSQNTYTTSRGKYFWEVSRTEHYDGAITGAVHKIVEESGDRVLCKPAGSFRIEGDGTVSRAPGFLKKAAVGDAPEPQYVVGSGGYFYV